MPLKRERKAKTELKDWMLKDVNRSAGVRCQALISLKNNVRVKDICAVLGVTRESLRLWKKAFESYGTESFIKHPKTGRKSGLTNEIKDLIKSVVNKSPEKFNYKQSVWDGKLLCKFLKEEKSIEISVRTAQNWLKSIGFTRQKHQKNINKTSKKKLE